ncbi:MAG: glycoside hydrolase family 3 N-terminal domain-containing protein [Candidatus Limnocylindrus sp.]
MRARARLVAVGLSLVLLAIHAPGPEVVHAVSTPTIEEMVGQKLIVRMDGHTPSAALTGRIQRGEIGGVILFSWNFRGAQGLTQLTRNLQAIARDAGRPPLFIAVDQEGGGIRRLPWAEPVNQAAVMGARLSVAAVRRVGRATGTALAAAGVNLNLAPVADTPRAPSGFMYDAGRTFSRTSARTARLATAFALGQESAGVSATIKHFPGIGRVAENTDKVPGTVTASGDELARDLAAFIPAINAGVDLVMLSNVTYTAYDENNAAGWSYAIATTLLRSTLGFTGVTITDSLDGTAHSRGVTARSLALRAAQAGVDLVILTSPEFRSEKAFTLLCAEAHAGHLSTLRLRASYDRILALKSGY